MNTEIAPEAGHVPRQPAPHKRPMKVNDYELITKNIGTLQLVPIFPYLDDGAIVPCLSISKGGSDLEPAQLFRDSDLAESILCLAGQGATRETAQLLQRPPVHRLHG